MKLSEAINMGSHTLDHMERCDIDKCALGAACNAVGISRSHTEAREKWPWLGKPGFTNYAEQYKCDGETAITSRFDIAVMQDKTMTLEQLIDYVASVEPSCGECNKFDCTCTPALSESQEEVLACSRP